uniref:Uncharacterized protein n=1 Tax=Arundo donax TaxID=35708 RepID=A0A0A9DVM6_ARUDO
MFKRIPPPGCYFCCYNPFSCIRKKRVAIPHKSFKTRLRQSTQKFRIYYLQKKKTTLVHLTFVLAKLQVPKSRSATIEYNPCNNHIAYHLHPISTIFCKPFNTQPTGK